MTTVRAILYCSKCWIRMTDPESKSPHHCGTKLRAINLETPLWQKVSAILLGKLENHPEKYNDLIYNARKAGQDDLGMLAETLAVEVEHWVNKQLESMTKEEKDRLGIEED